MIERWHQEIGRRKSFVMSVVVRDEVDLIDQDVGSCAVSSYDGANALEAAHIVPYADSGLSHAPERLVAPG